MNDVCPTCERPRDQWGTTPHTLHIDETTIDFCGQRCHDQWITARVQRAAGLEEWAFDADNDTAAAAGARLHLIIDELMARLDRAVALCQSSVDEAEASVMRMHGGEPFKAMVCAQDLLDILQPRKAPA